MKNKKQIHKALFDIASDLHLPKGEAGIVDVIVAGPRRKAPEGLSGIVAKHDEERSAPKPIKRNPLIMAPLDEAEVIKSKVMDSVKGRKSPFAFVPKSKAEIRYASEMLGVDEQDYQDLLDMGFDLMDLPEKESFDIQDIVDAIKSSKEEVK